MSIPRTIEADKRYDQVLIEQIATASKLDQDKNPIIIADLMCGTGELGLSLQRLLSPQDTTVIFLDTSAEQRSVLDEHMLQAPSFVKEAFSIRQDDGKVVMSLPHTIIRAFRQL